MDHSRIKRLRALATESVPVRVSGECMVPVLYDGQRVSVRRARIYLPGDIIIFPQPGGNLIAHRLLGYYRKQGQWLMLAKGDNNRHLDRGINPDTVVGKIYQYSPTGKDRLLSVGRFISTTVQHLLDVIRRKIPA